MTNLTETQNLILSAGAQRPDNLALPLPKRLVGAAAKMAVGKMIDRSWLQEVEANLRRGEPLWRETGDGHGTTLIVTEAGLLAVGIEPVMVQTMVALRERAKAKSEAEPKPPTPRAGTRRAQLIAMLQAPDGATMDEITAALSWLSKEKLLDVTVAVAGRTARVEIMNPFSNSATSPAELAMLREKQRFNESMLRNGGRPEASVVKAYSQAAAKAGEHELAADLLVALERIAARNIAVTTSEAPAQASLRGVDERQGQLL